MTCYPNDCTTTVSTTVQRAVPAAAHHATNGIAFTGSDATALAIVALAVIAVALVLIALSRAGR